ncbi:hypothetical protein L596_025770 [Steinernema carpocapsae]|uniref:V-SNARE coiled-coil homology domain-containing protein n=1 Tax=Steinernema carpocapsae TaxID=34508 RepID=A0A4U5M8S4_STECR|nr:hypothetical protein L596_025770 [Steinernema carpocapsae]
MDGFNLPNTPINAQTAKKIHRANQELDAVKLVMMNNIKNVLNRGEKLDVLNHRIDMLESGAGEFQVNARKARNQAYWSKNKWSISYTIFLTLFGMLLFFLTYDLMMNTLDQRTRMAHPVDHDHETWNHEANGTYGANGTAWNSM